jgi:internalin A
MPIPMVRIACCLAITLPVAAVGCNRSDPAPRDQPTQSEPAVPPAPVTSAPKVDSAPAPPAPKAEPAPQATDLESVKAAWKKAGARIGWMDEHKIDSPFFEEREDPRPGEIPAFYFYRLKDGLFDTLPMPFVPFGLSTGRPPPGGFRALSGLKHLRVLHLDLLFGGGNPPEATRPIEASLGALAEFKELRTLSLSNTPLSAQAREALGTLTQIETLTLGITAALKDADLKHIARLGQLRRLSIHKGSLTDADAKELGRLQRLEVLDIRDLSGSGIKLTEEGWRDLAGLKELRHLSLPCDGVTDAGLKCLGDLSHLRSLEFWRRVLEPGGRVTQAGLKELTRLTELQTLSLDGVQVQDADLAVLAGMKLRELHFPKDARTDLASKHYKAAMDCPAEVVTVWIFTDYDLYKMPPDVRSSVRSLSLGPRITDQGLKYVARLSQLQRLDLRLTNMTDAGLKELAGLKQLELLDLSDTRVTDAGLKELTGLKQLRHVVVRRRSSDPNLNRVTADGVDALKKAIPGIEVIMGP